MRTLPLLLVVVAIACRAERALTELPLQDYTQKKPAISLLIGTYRPDGASSEWLGRRGLTRPPSLQLFAGGRFQFSNVPESVATGWDDDRHRGVVTVEGTWSLRTGSNGWCVAIQGNYKDICFNQIYLLRGDSKPYRVDCPVGDRVTGFPFTLRRIA